MLRMVASMAYFPTNLLFSSVKGSELSLEKYLFTMLIEFLSPPPAGGYGKYSSYGSYKEKRDEKREAGGYGTYSGE